MPQALPKRWESFMKEEDLVPPPKKTFPRTAWRNGVFLIPPFDDKSPSHDTTRLHWAAYHASIEWAQNVASGRHIDQDCFVLAVLDKIMEDMSYCSQRRLLGIDPRFPTYVEWRHHTNDLIRKWYWTGVHRLPDGNPEPPSFRDTHAALRAAITSLFCRGVDADAAPAGPPPRYDRALLGRFDPNAREMPPVVRYVRPLQFRDREPPIPELNPALEAMSEARRERDGHKINVVETVLLPAVPVDMPDIDTPYSEHSISHLRSTSSTGSSDTEVALKTPIASAESSPLSKGSKGTGRAS